MTSGSQGPMALPVNSSWGTILRAVTPTSGSQIYPTVPLNSTVDPSLTRSCAIHHR